MKIPRFRLYRYPLKDEEDGIVSNTGSEIDKNFSLTLKEGIETNKDTFEITIKNVKNPNGDVWDTKILRRNIDDNTWNKGDFISLHAWEGAYEPSSDKLNTDFLMMYGVVNTFDSETSPDGGQSVTIKGVNATEQLLNTMTPTSTKAEEGEYNTSPLLIQFLVNERLNKFNEARPVYAYLDNEINPYTGSYGYLASSKSDGTPFPKIDYAKTWTPIYKQIEELSTEEYTQDFDAGTYQIYIKSSKVRPEKVAEEGDYINELVWQPKSQTPDLTLEEGKDFKNSSLSWDVREVFNAFIFNAGTDLFGVGIIGVAINQESISKYGAKWKYYDIDRHMFSKKYTDEKTRAKALGSEFVEQFPKALEAGSTWTFGFKDRNENGEKLDYYATAESKDEFNQQLVDEARFAVKEKAQTVANNMGEPRFQIDVDLLYGTNDIAKGALYEIIKPSLGWEGTEQNPGYKLRLVDIQQSKNRKGFNTKLTLKEDEETISRKVNDKEE